MATNDPKMSPLDDALRQAIVHHQAGRLAEAEQLYRRVLQERPQHPEANYNLGGLAMQLGKPALGLPHLKAAVDGDPGQGVYWLSFANALLAAGDGPGALTILTRARQRGFSGRDFDGLMAQARKAGPARPSDSDAAALYAQAVQHHQAGRIAEASPLYGRYLALQPNHAEAHNNFGLALHAQGRLDEAVAAYRRAVALKPDLDRGHNNLGSALKDQGKPDEAEASIRRAVALNPASDAALFNLASLLQAHAKLDDAVALYGRVLALNPNFVQAHFNLGNALKDQGKLDDAIAAYRRAVAVAPPFAEAHNSIGALLLEQGKPVEAQEALRQALALKPDFAQAHNNLGNALVEQMKLDDAMESYRAAIAAMPDFVEAHSNLGNALVLDNRTQEGFAMCARAATMAYGNPATPRSDNSVAPHKRLHDREQRDYLAETSPGTTTIDDALRLGDGGRLAGSAINPDRADIATQWERNRPQIVVIDDFLTATALEKLRLFCWNSTIWRHVYNDGYLGAFPETGLACPLLAQIADEMRLAYPTIFRDHPLRRLWAFKYDSKLKGIKLHADFAAVNVNFWITPDEANLDPAGGGLIIWDVPAPLDWDFARYNNDVAASREFLAHAGARSTTVPYRANRAVIFDSDLFHETDRITFKDGYLNRRINLTLLYGRRGA